MKRVWALLFVAVLAAPTFAQPLEPSLPRDRRELSRVKRNTQVIPRDIAPQPATQPPKGRNVVVLMAGIGWADWARLAAQKAGSTPGLFHLLSGADLGALRLPGAPRGETFDEPSDGHGELLAERSLMERSRVSPTILRAAATISTGQPMGWPASNVPEIPLAATATLGVDEPWSNSTPGYEDASPSIAYARRVGKDISGVETSVSLVNLAGALWRSDVTPADSIVPRFGALGDAMRRNGANAAAFGSADTNFDPSRTLPLREWALLACDSKGTIPHGDVSTALLTRDSEAPFGVRTDGTALLGRVQSALDAQDSLIVIEWGDTRRAALYAPLCEPFIAARHKRLALERADKFLRLVLNKLTKEDRLFLISVPDLDTPRPQWIPCAYWSSSDERATKGRLISGGGEHDGVAPLESVFSTLLTRLTNPNAMAPPNPAPPLGSQGAASLPLERINRLASLQSGWAWLDAARPVAHGIWAIFFLVSIIILVALLTQSTPNARFGQVTETPTGLLSSSQNWARAWWSTTMLLPLLMWLGGVCIEATWRFGALPTADQSSSPTSWRLPVALALIAIFIVGLAGLARTWFSRARLRGVRVGLIYLLLTVIGLLIGGFALPWNSLLSAPVLEGSSSRSGDIWSLLLISATLLGIGGMAQPSQRTLEQLAAEPLPRRNRNGNYDEDDAMDRPSRRIINLRPAVIWMIAVLLLLWLAPLGHNAAAGVVGIFGFGTLWLRLWLERAERPQRLRKRRWIVASAFALGVLLLLPQGAPGMENALAEWWPRWLDTWSDWWWNVALLATALGAGAFLTSARVALRNYLRVRYAIRAMLAGAVVSAAVALIIFGSFGPPLIALYTLGAVIFQVLGAPAMETQSRGS